MLRSLRNRLVPLLAAAGILAAGSAHAAYPERTVTLIVPFAAGGITDILARIAADSLSNALKQPFVVENRPGAAGALAAERVRKSAPDGYTLLFTPIFQIATAPIINPSVTFDPIKDFAPIAAVGATPFVITVSGDFKGDTLSDFIAHVKKTPDKIPFGSAGTGSMTHVSSVVFLKSAGLDMIHVPYKGVGPAFTALLSGQVAMISASPVEIKPFLESKKVKPLAITDDKPTAQLAGVPAITETLKDSPPVVTYNGLLAPGGTPQAIIDLLSRELMAAEKSPEFRQRLAKIGVEPVENTPEQFAKLIANDVDQWGRILKELNLRPN